LGSALKLAHALGDKKLENRASGELGFALFLEETMATARQKSLVPSWGNDAW